MAKEFTYHGSTTAKLKEMSMDEFIKLLPSRQRRSLRKGVNQEQQQLLRALKEADVKDTVRTHARDMIILPQMIGKRIAVYNGKEFVYVDLNEEMVGHFLGEYALTRKNVKHSAAGIGATRSTKFVSVR